MRGGSIKIFRRFFLSHSAENFRKRILYCGNDFGYRKNLDKRGGVSKICVEFFCLTVLKIPVGVSFTVAIISGIKKVWIREGGVSRFSVEKFLCHSAENFRRGLFFCCNNFGYKKVWIREGGSIKMFCRNFFVSQCRNISPGNL